MRHSDKARYLRAEFHKVTGVWPAYPRSRAALDELRTTLDRFIETQQKYKDSQKKIEDRKAFNEEYDRLAQIDLINTFDLDTKTSAGELEGEVLQLLNEAKREHRREGAFHVFSSWRQEVRDYTGLGDTDIDDHIRIVGGNMILDYTLSKRRAAGIIDQHENVFLLKTKFLREQEENLWVVEDGFQPIKWGATRGQQTVEVSRGTEPGALYAIDQRFFNVAYPVPAVVYGLYPIREPNQDNLQPMRDGSLNCVAQRVIEHFKGTKRGDGLTTARLGKIEEWEREIHETGATLKDVSGLEKILRRSIIVRDIAGLDLYNSGKYKKSRWAPIDIILHNGHAWGADLKFPIARQVTFFEGYVWDAIKEVTKDQPKAVWLIGSGKDKRLSVDQFILQNGRTFRTQELHDRLLEICRRLPTDKPDVLAQRVFSENHAATILASSLDLRLTSLLNAQSSIMNSLSIVENYRT